jgi:TolA-binding protein
MKKNTTESGRLLFQSALLIFAVSLVITGGCSGKAKDAAYNAEREFYEARKLRMELSDQWVVPGTEFLDRTLLAYQNLLARYTPQMYEVDGLENIVVTAQMDLAEIYFQAAMLPEARREFEKAFEIAKHVRDARIAALYSAAHLSEQIEEPDSAITLFERFNNLFLDSENVIQTAGLNVQYLTTPLKLAELYASMGDQKSEQQWLRKAESFYRNLIVGTNDPEILKTVRYNLLTTLLQDRQWQKALDLLREFLFVYTEGSEHGALLFLEGKIYQDGFKQPRKAYELFKKLHDDHPDLPQASSALLSAAAEAKELGQLDLAVELYKQVLEEYPSESSVMAEAQWELAVIDEERGDWIDASSRYRLLNKEYPTTIQGLEAPLRIAYRYRKNNEKDLAKTAFERALGGYEKVLSYQYSLPVKILAEEYVVRTLVEMERWQDAVDRLLSLPKKYPSYLKFQMNYLTAASILADKLKDTETARLTLNKCIERYPGSKAASLAAEQLKNLK